jgi:TDG/mug DNA glycosylase family protein
MAPLVQSFAPVIVQGCHTLILGSMPGERSLAIAEYYGHPANAFWPVMGELFGFSPSLPYQDRLHKLNQAGIALWDVMASCERKGSLDSAISRTTITPNAIPELLQHYPDIQRIILNGSAAAVAFRKQVLPKLQATSRSCSVVQAPSTSPAHAAMPQTEKLRRWASLFEGTSLSVNVHGLMP